MTATIRNGTLSAERIAELERGFLRAEFGAGHTSTVYGTVIQADSIGDVHVTVQEAVVSPPAPRELLPVPAVWTDRTYDLVQMAAAVDRLSADSVRIIAISGPSGIGKTALAAKFLHAQMERFPGGALYADLRGYAPGGPASTPEILARLLRSARPGVRATTVDELGAWWRTATADPKRAMCVLLDNAVDADQVQALLPGGPGHIGVTTSHHVLEGLAGHGARFHAVEPLDDEAAHEYLVRQLGRDRVTADRRATDQIVRLSAGLPMALAVVVGALAARTGQSLATTATDLVRTQSAVRTARPVLTPQEVAVTTVNDRYQQLPPPAATVYRRLGSLFALDFDAALAAAVSGLPRADALDALHVLHAAGLIEMLPGVENSDDGGVHRADEW